MLQINTPTGFIFSAYGRDASYSIGDAALKTSASQYDVRNVRRWSKPPPISQRTPAHAMTWSNNCRYGFLRRRTIAPWMPQVGATLPSQETNIPERYDRVLCKSGTLALLQHKCKAHAGSHWLRANKNRDAQVSHRQCEIQVPEFCNHSRGTESVKLKDTKETKDRRQGDQHVCAECKVEQYCWRVTDGSICEIFQLTR